MAKWIPIKGKFSDRYAVNRKGEIKSLLSGKVRKSHIDTAGYRIVDLKKNGKRTTVRNHVISANHFLPNPKNLPVRNHKDLDRSNPAVSNLEFVTQSENMIHSHMVRQHMRKRKNGVSIIKQHKRKK